MSHDLQNSAPPLLKLATLIADRDEWKKRHDMLARRVRILTERPDMPLDRLKAFELAGALRAQIALIECLIALIECLIASDAHAMTYQSIGQYRTALLQAIRETAP